MFCIVHIKYLFSNDIQKIKILNHMTSFFQADSGDSNSSGSRVLQKEVDHGLLISLKKMKKWKWILRASMPERLMGTNCKFGGNMSTLVQIQLSPINCINLLWDYIRSFWVLFYSTHHLKTESLITLIIWGAKLVHLQPFIIMYGK